LTKLTEFDRIYSKPCPKSPAVKNDNLSSMKIVSKDYHANGSANPFVVAIVDSPEDGDTKLVIMFEDTDYTAVLSLDYLVRDEDISAKYNGHHGERFEKLREDLWDDFLG
jgi:hypothetical protein